MALPIVNALAQPQPSPDYASSLQQLKLRVPEGYAAGPLQKAQETAQASGGAIPNELLLSGPDGDFYRALAAFQQHFGGAR